MTVFHLRSALGSIPLAAAPGQASAWSLMSGTRGLGLAPTVAGFSDSATVGGSLSSSRVGMREPLLRIETTGATEEELAANLATLQKALRSTGLPSGTPAAVIMRRSAPLALVASESSSFSGALWLMLEYVDGGPDAYDDGGDLSVTWDLTMKATWPYWQSTPRVSSSTLTATSVAEAITNTGTVDTPVRVVINGPVVAGTTFTLASGSRTVGSLTIATGWTSGSRVLDFSDSGWTFKSGSTNRYMDLAPDLILPMAPPGPISLLVTPPTGGEWAGSAVLSLTPMVEVVR